VGNNKDKCLSCLISGGTSNSKYVLTGALQTVTQIVFYEVYLVLTLIFYLCLISRIKIIIIILNDKVWNKVILLLSIVEIWSNSYLVETDWTPF